MVMGVRDDGDASSLSAFEGEHAAVEFFKVGSGALVAVGGDELDADLVEGEGGVAVVGDDDPDGNEAVRDVGETEEVAVFGVEAGIGGDGDFFRGVGVEGRVLRSGFGGRGLLFARERGVMAARTRAAAVRDRYEFMRG